MDIMKEQLDVRKLIKSGKIKDELEFERASILHRKLRILSKENPEYKEQKSKLYDLLLAYEKNIWPKNGKIDDAKIAESDFAEYYAEQERLFINNRKQLIREHLKECGINQQQLGKVLGHTSKSYMSELMNGVRPFTLRDIIVIKTLFDMRLSDLIFTTLPLEDNVKIQKSIERLKCEHQLDTSKFATELAC